MEAELREKTGFTNWNTALARYTKESGKLGGQVRSAWAMYNGDMWDRGNGYIGPRPIDTDPTKDRVMALISVAFTTRNVIAEVTNRTVGGLISRSPGWFIYDQNKLVSKAIDEAQKRLTLQKQADVFNKGIAQLMSAKPGDAIQPIEQEQSRSVEATADNGNIIINAQNEGANRDNTETVNRKEIEAEIILSDLWTRLNLKQVISDTLVERLVTGRGGARVFIPKKYFKQVTNEEDKDNAAIPENKKRKETIVNIPGFLNALKAVRVENVKRSDIKVVDQEGTKISIVRLERRQASTGKTTKVIELSFVNDNDGKTYVAVLENGTIRGKKTNQNSLATLNEDNIDAKAIIDDILDADISNGIFLDDNLIACEMEGTPFVTESLMQCNRALNLTLTLGVNVLVEDGFTEMITTNAALATIEVPDPNNPGQMIKREVGLRRGSSYMNNIVGLASYDKDGMKKYESPEVKFREPTSLDSFDNGERLFYRSCLAEAKQSFIISTEDSEVSGDSRIQARQDFVSLIKNYKTEVDGFGSWLLSTLLNMVASIAGQDGYFKGLGVNFDCKVFAGDLSSSEQEVILSRYEKGLISREDALVLYGTEDPFIEIDKIRADQAEKQYNEVRRLVVTSHFSNQIQADKEVNGDDEKKPTDDPTKDPTR